MTPKLVFEVDFEKKNTRNHFFKVVFYLLGF